MFEINEEFSTFPFLTISPMWDFKALQGNVKHFPTLKRPEEKFNISAPFPFSAPVAVAIPIPSEPSPSLLRQPLMLSFLNELKSKDLKIAELDDKVATNRLEFRLSRPKFKKQHRNTLSPWIMSIAFSMKQSNETTAS